MSVKTAFFNTLMKAGPAVRHTYVISIPGFTQLAFLVSSAPVPTPQRGVASVNFMGETYSFPTSVQLSAGDWAVQLYETALGEVSHAFYYAFTNDLKAPFFNVDIYSFQGDYSFSLHTRLLNCWVKGFSAPGLDGSASSDVVSCTLNLAYNGVELVESASDNPVANLLKYSAYHLASKPNSIVGAVNASGSLINMNPNLASDTKELNLRTSNIVGGAKLLNALLTKQIII